MLADNPEFAGQALTAIELQARMALEDLDHVLGRRMPRVDGIAATERIVAAPDAPRVVVVATFDNDEYVYGALRVGASGFLLKRARPDEIIDAIRLVPRELVAVPRRDPGTGRTARSWTARRPPAVGRVDRPRGGGVAPDGRGAGERRDRR